MAASMHARAEADAHKARFTEGYAQHYHAKQRSKAEEKADKKRMSASRSNARDYKMPGLVHTRRHSYHVGTLEGSRPGDRAALHLKNSKKAEHPGRSKTHRHTFRAEPKKEDSDDEFGGRRRRKGRKSRKTRRSTRA